MPKIRATLLVFLLFCTFAFINIGVVSSSSYITLDPSDLQFNAAGEEITTRVVFSNIPDFYAFDIEINFDPDMAEVVSLEEGSAFEGKSSIDVSDYKKFNTDEGVVRIAKTLLGDDVLPSEGELAIITFRAKAKGSSSLNINPPDIVVLTDNGLDYFTKDPSGGIPGGKGGGGGGGNKGAPSIPPIKELEISPDDPEKIPGIEMLKDIAGHWAENNIQELVALGAISGYPDGTFKPDNNITRAEFATVLVKAFQLEPQSGKIFKDTAGHWAQETISTAASYGIVSGYSADTFGPDDLITREQMAVMVVKAAKLTPAAVELSFTDSAGISEWAREAMTTAVANGIINGYPDNTVRPQGSATRAEAVTVIVNALPEPV